MKYLLLTLLLLLMGRPRTFAQTPPPGRVVVTHLDSKLLRGNAGGENPRRRVSVYLPPDYEAKPAGKPSATAAKDESGPKDGKGEDKSDAAKPESSEAVKAETGTDLARARALAVLDYLQKAGVPLDRAAAPADAAPLPDRQGIGLSLRS